MQWHLFMLAPSSTVLLTDPRLNSRGNPSPLNSKSPLTQHLSNYLRVNSRVFLKGNHHPDTQKKFIQTHLQHLQRWQRADETRVLGPVNHHTNPTDQRIKPQKEYGLESMPMWEEFYVRNLCMQGLKLYSSSMERFLGRKNGQILHPTSYINTCALS